MNDNQNLEEKVKTGHGLARFLRDHGVKYVFGVPDGHTLPLYDGILATNGIEHILFNDERSAAFAADAYARVTGTLGVCDAGSAGAMNLPVALAEAKGSASPVLAIVGTIKSKDKLRNIPHDINVEDTLKPITKWTEKILDAEYLPRFLSFGIKQAINGKSGPVALVISEDVLYSTQLQLKYFLPRVEGTCSINSCRPTPAMDEIDNALKLIKHAKQPTIFTGGGAILSGAYYEISELSRILNAPVFSTISGKGIMISKDNPKENLYFGTVGLFGEKPNHQFINEKSDLIIVIGNRLTEDDTANFKFPDQHINMIQIDIDPAEIGLSYNPWGIVGDPKSALIEIISRLKEEPITKANSSIIENEIKDAKEIIDYRSKNLEWLGKEHEKYRQIDTKKWLNSELIKPQRVLKAISDNFTEQDYLVTDASSSSRWIGPYFPVKNIGRKIITPRGVGPTGFGVGALIGTSIAVEALYGEKNNIKKILFTGDGGLMNGGINEFETIVRLGLDCTIIVINNSALGFIKFAQKFLFRKRYYNTDRPQTNFAKLTEIFGGIGTRVEKLKDLDEGIRNAIHSKGFSLVDVVVDPKEFLPPNYYI
ncbi:MAG: thiamine pyrophosphate-binding protein [Promethearchaeota archaeon]